MDWGKPDTKKKKHTSLIPPPSGGKWNIQAGDRKERGREGGREGCLQISAISQPDCLLTERGHCSSFPLDGGRRGLETGGWIWVLLREAPNKKLRLWILIRSLKWHIRQWKMWLWTKASAMAAVLKLQWFTHYSPGWTLLSGNQLAF